MPEARSPKYTALFDPESGVRFRHGRAEVTEEQARILAGRRFMDGILIDGIPAKKWAQQNQPPVDAPPLPTDEPDPESEPSSTVPNEKPGRSRKAT